MTLRPIPEFQEKHRFTLPIVTCIQFSANRRAIWFTCYNHLNQAKRGSADIKTNIQSTKRAFDKKFTRKTVNMPTSVSLIVQHVEAVVDQNLFWKQILVLMHTSTGVTDLH